MRLRKNDNAQVNVLEIIIVAGLIFASLYFIQGLSTPNYPETTEKSQLKTRMDSALKSIDAMKPLNKSQQGVYDSALVECIFENNTYVPRTSPPISYRNYLISYLNNYMSPTYAFNIYVYNISEMQKNSTISEVEYKDTFYTSDVLKIGLKSQSSRIFVNNGYIYEVMIETWYV